MDRRGRVGLFGGLTGLALGVSGALLDSPVLALLAGVSALVAGAAALALHERPEADAAPDAQASAPLPAAGPAGFVDAETGVPDGRFFELAVETHVRAAKRQLWPMSIVLLDVVPWDELRHAEVMVGFVRLVRQTLRDADVVCRIGPGSFGLILDDTSEAGGVWAAERMQAIAAGEGLAARAVVASVASYPAHGLEPAEVMARARAALARARAGALEGRTAGVEVATVESA